MVVTIKCYHPPSKRISDWAIGSVTAVEATLNNVFVATDGGLLRYGKYSGTNETLPRWYDPVIIDDATASAVIVADYNNDTYPDLIADFDDRITCYYGPGFETNSSQLGGKGLLAAATGEVVTNDDLTLWGETTEVLMPATANAAVVAGNQVYASVDADVWRFWNNESIQVGAKLTQFKSLTVMDNVAIVSNGTEVTACNRTCDAILKGTSLRDLRVADVDGDGSLDLLGVNGTNDVLWYERDARVNLWRARSVSGGSSFAVADVDADGAPDVVVVYRGLVNDTGSVGPGFRVSWSPNVCVGGSDSSAHHVNNLIVIGLLIGIGLLAACAFIGVMCRIHFSKLSHRRTSEIEFARQDLRPMGQA